MGRTRRQKRLAAHSERNIQNNNELEHAEEGMGNEA
jgi:hypothetical protein